MTDGDWKKMTTMAITPVRPNWRKVSPLSDAKVSCTPLARTELAPQAIV